MSRLGILIYLLINLFTFLILRPFYFFYFTRANRYKVIVVNLKSYTTREVTYPSQQDREWAALQEEDGVLVVSLFVTLIMESPPFPWSMGSVDEWGCVAIVYYRFSRRPCSCNQTWQVLDSYTVRDKNEHSRDHSPVIRYTLAREMHHALAFRYILKLVKFCQASNFHITFEELTIDFYLKFDVFTCVTCIKLLIPIRLQWRDFFWRD